MEIYQFNRNKFLPSFGVKILQALYIGMILFSTVAKWIDTKLS